MGFLIKVAAGYGALADFILTGGRRGFAKGTGDFNAALAKQREKKTLYKQLGVELSRRDRNLPMGSLENYQWQGWLRSLAENGTLNPHELLGLGYKGPIKHWHGKAWTDKATQNFIDTARRTLDPRAEKYYARLIKGRKLSEAKMRLASDKLYVELLEYLAGRRPYNPRNLKQPLTMRDAALARYLADNPEILRNRRTGEIDEFRIGLGPGRSEFNRALRKAVSQGFNDYRVMNGFSPYQSRAMNKIPVPPKTKPSWLSWRNLGIGGAAGLGLAGGGAAWYGATRPGEVSASEEANSSRNATAPVNFQGQDQEGVRGKGSSYNTGTYNNSGNAYT